MKLCVDRTKCTGLGICESLAPDYFEIDDAGQLLVLREHTDDRDIDDVRAAIEGCPTEALTLVED
ncbi:ferredoxin [Rhodococcus opacus]|uniref:Ferredoxin n=1 Tax=Rhodococcus opacus M213 TaxID=1129896 RepID=K8XBN9_RHOOP|nr:ferredoxin [Rhodococcus opacus]NDV10360.1 ferredoxin [Rhodococcus sp. IEGM 248]TQC42399.1 ferredoxin [Rhodococcus sp. WS4]EKT78256.1 3Fe-4S ferredoxin [Rhodococcus opacus M213]MDV7089902.1 ferredoxin [Rhodococcus opacus]QZS56784.1 ferredoxin [Rhodococcus opacus]